MPIRPMQEKDIDLCLTLFNEVIKQQHLPYKQLDKKLYASKFLISDSKLISLVYQEDDNIHGFISGSVVHQKAFITMVMVHPEKQRRKMGSFLLKTFEDTILSNYPDVQKIEILFFNPIQLEWIIPNTDHHDHPNAPGVDQSSDAYHFFLHHGYIPFAKQNAYYKPLNKFEYSLTILDLISKLHHMNIHITFYQPHIHDGFEKLFSDLNNTYWTDEISKAILHQEPVLIAEKDNQMIGFTGPLKIQPSKRGYFAGIGVHSAYRGLGIGKVLFASLCMNLFILGAEYVSLFTGENNPARKIYENEQFEIVKSWANMRKEIRK